jgi:hypothetical protein
MKVTIGMNHGSTDEYESTVLVFSLSRLNISKDRQCKNLPISENTPNQRQLLNNI